MNTPVGTVAIVGSGPSGCYTASAIRKAAPAVEIVVLDALPTPFGLVRHGVAPDHQGMKAVTRQFQRVFADGGARFVGGVEVGDAVSLRDLEECFDVVVLATGLPADRPLGVPGDDLPGVYGAGEIVQLLNSHPDAKLRAEGALPTSGLGQEVAIIGTGNVAIDVARLIAKTTSEFIGSDVDDDALERLQTRGVRRIKILGRGSAQHARWDPSMVRELAATEAVTLSIDGRALGAPAVIAPEVTVEIQFASRPTAIAALDQGLSLTFADSIGTRSEMFDSVITAIGFVANGAVSSDPLPRNSRGRVFRVGGCDSGVLGNMAQNRKAAQVTAAAVVETLRSQDNARPGWRMLTELLHDDVIDFSGWQMIDAAECARAAAGRSRKKFTSRQELHAVGRRKADTTALR